MKRFGWYVLLLTATAIGSASFVPSNIDPAHKFAWSENVGWTNWLDAGGTVDGVFVDTTGGFLAGYLWAENVGWINLGDGAGPYANTADTDYGVNIEPDDDLTGYAWGENIGWVNFGWGAAADLTGRARFDGTAQRFRGYAWGENVGWTNLDDATHYVGVAGIPVCNDKADCADANLNSLRDDNCVYWECAANTCVGPTDQVFADIGGSGGSCVRDGSADANDGFHVLNCFANSNFGQPGNYACDDALLPMNADVGGAGGSCCPDGACDANDKFHVLKAFAAGGAATSDGCGCPLQGLPHSCSPPNATAPYAPRFTDSATLVLVPSRVTVPLTYGRGSDQTVLTTRAGDVVSVDVFIENAVPLQGYQMHLGVSGGKAGTLELVDVTIADRADHVYRGLPYWEAFNVKTHQMMAGLDAGPVATKADGYLATFTYRVSSDAAGTFVIDVLGHSTSKSENRTFLFGPISQGMVDLVGTKPAVIDVRSSRAQER